MTGRAQRIQDLEARLIAERAAKHEAQREAFELRRRVTETAQRLDSYVKRVTPVYRETPEQAAQAKRNILRHASRWVWRALHNPPDREDTGLTGADCTYATTPFPCTDPDCPVHGDQGDGERASRIVRKGRSRVARGEIYPDDWFAEKSKLEARISELERERDDWRETAEEWTREIVEASKAPHREARLAALEDLADSVAESHGESEEDTGRSIGDPDQGRPGGPWGCCVEAEDREAEGFETGTDWDVLKDWAKEAWASRGGGSKS